MHLMQRKPAAPRVTRPGTLGVDAQGSWPKTVFARRTCWPVNCTLYARAAVPFFHTWVALCLLCLLVLLALPALPAWLGFLALRCLLCLLCLLAWLGLLCLLCFACLRCLLCLLWLLCSFACFAWPFLLTLLACLLAHRHHRPSSDPAACATWGRQLRGRDNGAQPFWWPSRHGRRTCPYARTNAPMSATTHRAALMEHVKPGLARSLQCPTFFTPCFFCIETLCSLKTCFCQALTSIN